MDQDILPKILNSIGIFFDIIGAVLIAWEVVQQYKGCEFENRYGLPPVSYTPPPEKTPKYKKWERNKYVKMKWGLGALVLGFLLQLASNWTYIFK